jgi:ribosome recycling factor
MIEQYLKELTPKAEKAVEFLESELSAIHTGRASTSLVDTILVDAYGGKQEIRQIANITVPEARQILIQPWDRMLTASIEKAIRESDLGFNPVNAGDVIRINIPELTQERRQEFAKVAKEKAEDAKVAIRNARQDTINQIKKAKTDGEIGEDEMYRGEGEVQKIVEKYNKQIEEILGAKEKELLEI